MEVTCIAIGQYILSRGQNATVQALSQNMIKQHILQSKHMSELL